MKALDGRLGSLLLIALGFALAIFVAVVPVTSNTLSLDEGDLATRTIRAPRDISFVSEALTDRRQEEAAAAVPDSLTYDPAVAVKQQAELNTILSGIGGVLNDQRLATSSARAGALERVDKLNLSPGSLAMLSEMSPAEFRRLDTEARRALAGVFQESLPASGIQETRERASTFVTSAADRATSTLIAEVIRPLILPNLAVDNARTQAGRDGARAAVSPVKVAYAKGQLIVEEDAPITPEAREALLHGGVFQAGVDIEAVGASAILGAAGAAALVAGLHAFRPRASWRQVAGVAFGVVIPVLALKTYLPLILPDEDRHFLAYVMPVAAAAMVLSGLVGAELALLAVSLITLLAAFAAALLLDITVVGLAGTLDVIRIALVAMLSGAAGIFAVRNAERLSHFLLGGVAVFFAVMAALTATWLIDSAREANDFAWMVLAAGANGALSAFLAAGVFVTLGSVFGVTTRLQLLEMSQLSQPLMLRLQDEAPSTFQHSVIVANLAEKGAHLIGADALLARVGCYYHDVGKLRRPGFFVENQLGGDNPHDALRPEDSARIIADHVNAGLELAREYNLPQRVACFIPEHHGTRLVAFFYRRAVEEDGVVDDSAFRYPGPKPQSRETAIAMLADSCEAAVRAAADHSPARIDAIVDEVFAERVQEGELDESDLTLRNLRKLSESFKATLHAVYHPRIEYPAPTEAELLQRGRRFRGAPSDPADRPRLAN